MSDLRKRKVILESESLNDFPSLFLGRRPFFYLFPLDHRRPEIGSVGGGIRCRGAGGAGGAGRAGGAGGATGRKEMIGVVKPAIARWA